MSLLTSLIDKQDSFEIVRDAIYSILTNEISNQMALATLASKDPALWEVEIYQEHSNAFEKYLRQEADATPLANIWLANMNYDPAASNSQQRVRVEALYNIDLYAYGVGAENETTGGQYLGDVQAALKLHRAMRLVRNILSSPTYRYLHLKFEDNGKQYNLVEKTRIENYQIFQPQLGENPVQNVIAGRLSFRVVFNEFGILSQPENIEFISVDVKRSSDDFLLAEADYDYT